MEIVEIFKGHLYSVRYDGQEDDEYTKAFDLWHDLDYLLSFFKKYAGYMNAEVWIDAGLSPDDPYKSAERVISEADDLEKYIEELIGNTQKCRKPELGSLFRHLEGKYKFLTELVPQKSYGRYWPSLIRLYAIRLEENCFLVVYGGIKVGSKIQNSPVLDKKVIPAIDNVLSFLQSNGIAEQDDL